MKKTVFCTCILFLWSAGQSWAADWEQRFQRLEATIQKQQKVIEAQQAALDELRNRIAKEKAGSPAGPADKDRGQKAEAAPAEGKIPPADRSLQLEKKYSEGLKPLGVYSFSQGRFVPDIAFILDGSYLDRNRGDETFRTLEVPEFIHSRAEEAGSGHSHGSLNEKKGFNLNYGEMSLYAPVDPYFDLNVTIPFSEEGVELEEAYFSTRALPVGFQLKGGKFRSSFGRINIQHPHVWDFGDAPLVNRAFFGTDGLVEKGMQLTWLAPAPFYLLLGTEILQGENEASFGTGSLRLEKEEMAFSRDAPAQPNLITAFVKSSWDIGRLSLLGGLSYARGETRIDHMGGESPQGGYGSTKIYGVDLTAKYFLDSYRYISWQNEYLYRYQDLHMAADTFPQDPEQPLEFFGKEKKQSGFYSQLVFKFDRQWRIGARYDLLNQNDVFTRGVKQDLPTNLDRFSAMLEYRPTEFSSLRLQFNRDNSLFSEGGNREPVNEIFLQFNMAIGAHGSHRF